MIRSAILILGASALLAGLTYWISPPLNYEEHPLFRSWETVQGWEDEIIWVDARERDAYEEAHWPGAILLNEDEFELLIPGLLEVWNPDARVLVYCEVEGCDRSLAVTQRLREEFQMENVFVLQGGWEVLNPSP
jgi:rhodanese-related sulfurtransferase